MGKTLSFNQRIDNFWNKVDKSNKCWIWYGNINHSGYGVFFNGERRTSVQRFVWELNNPKLKSGICVLQTCNNKLCVNPIHLYIDNNRRPDKDTPSKLWDNTIIDKDTDCWLWQGKRNKQGYGEITWNGKWYRTNRLSYSLTHENIKLTEEQQVCHHCDNPPCINPAHLFLGTAKDNAQDAISKGRINYSHIQNILSEQDVITIKEELKHYRYGMCRQLAKKYNVTDTAITNIKNGWNWKNIL